MEIEKMFCSLKSGLNADRSYMHSDEALEGWVFINHLSLQLYQSIYQELKEKKLINKTSVNDYIKILTDVKKIKINNEWHLNETTSKTLKLMKDLIIEV